MGKLTDEGKHTVKGGYHPHKKLVGRLKDKSSKIIYEAVKEYTKQLDVKYLKNSNHKGVLKCI